MQVEKLDRDLTKVIRKISLEDAKKNKGTAQKHFVHFPKKTHFNN